MYKNPEVRMCLVCLKSINGQGNMSEDRVVGGEGAEMECLGWGRVKGVTRADLIGPLGYPRNFCF